MKIYPIVDLAQWYQKELSEAFPPNERKPLAEIERLLAAGRYQVLGLYGDDGLLAYATLNTDPAYPDYLLLDYLGVTARLRSQGIGAQFLALLGERFRGACIIAESECPGPDCGEAENRLRQRRIGFYERCGLTAAYEMATCGVRFRAMILGEPGDLDALMTAHRAIYGPERTDVRIPLPPGETPPPSHWA